MEPNWDTININGWQFKNDETKLIQYFSEFASKYPDSARAKFELANAYDYLGEEDSAIPFYEKAIHIGLTPEYEAYALLQLGSSLRNVGMVDKAAKILSEAEKRYPELPSITILLGMALYDQEQHSEALKVVLNGMMRHIKTADMERYKEALKYYMEDFS